MRKVCKQINLRIRAMGVEAFAPLAGSAEALVDVVRAGGPLEPRSALAEEAVLEGGARRAVLARPRGAVVLQVAVDTCKR